MKEEQTYYKKIMLSSGEVPEEPKDFRSAQIYDTDQGPLAYIGKLECEHGWYCDNTDRYPKVNWWYKEVTIPSNKEEAVKELIEDYKKKVSILKDLNEKEDIEINKVRLITKASCYKTFITELERVIR